MSFEASVPRHLRTPGDDGYRTPTIEDAERTISFLREVESHGGAARNIHTTALEATLQKVSSRATDNQYRKESSHCAEPNGERLDRTTTASSAPSLGWKKRIRHVTWAYFTMTMATGGLANVLYEGKYECK